MKKHITKSNIMFLIIGIIIGSIGIVIADTIHSNEVLYDNSNSSSSATDVQEALNDVYNTLDKVGSGYSLIAHAPDNLSTELVAGLYRYQGVQDANNNVNNYICFGTTNKNTCVNDTDKYMYRIIGITSNGQMKLIKKEALNTAYRWSATTNINWPNSELFAGLNGSYFLTNTDYVPSTWENRIVVSDWHYVDTTNFSIATIGDTELNGPATNAKIGLMYVHDVNYSIPNPNNNQNDSTSWIYMSKNDSGAPTPVERRELLITRANNGFINILSFDTAHIAWTQYSSNMTNLYAVRPVFFLNSSETIASGSGTIADPYILS